jgi:hypothetical protein
MVMNVTILRMMSGNQTSIHNCDPESKRQGMEWKHPQLPSKKEFRSQPSAEKLMHTVLWKSQGPVLECYQERGSTINSVPYIESLTDGLKPAI